MSDGITDAAYAEYRYADAEDRREAARIAAALAGDKFTSWQDRADTVYAWLRARPTVAPHSLTITPSTPSSEETP